MKLVAEAQTLMRQGRVAEAEAMFSRVLEANPGHVEALNVLGLSAIRRGRLSEGIGLLERAARSDPNDALTQHNLGRSLEARGDFAGALLAYEASVRLRSDFSVGRLYWAAMLERTRHTQQAVVQYVRALDDAQRDGRWLTPESTPPTLRPMIEHAVLMVRQHRNEAFTRLFEPLVKAFGADSLKRVAQVLRVYLRQEEAVFSDPRQRPSFLFMPGLPTSPYVDRSHFPWIDEFEARTPHIRRELLDLLPRAHGSERIFSSEEIERANLRGNDKPPSWTGYYFYRHGQLRSDNCSACPQTASALQVLPLTHVRDHGPEVLFSVFSPGTHLLPHQGVTNTRMVGHLPLIIPEECALRVGGEIHEWVEGRVVVFDDTYEHEAWNRSKSIRVVLIFDIWNPYLTEVERTALAELVSGIGDFRETVTNA